MKTNELNEHIKRLFTQVKYSKLSEDDFVKEVKKIIKSYEK